MTNTASHVSNEQPHTAAPARQTTETKSAFKTSELIVYVVVVIGIIVVSVLTGDGEGDGADIFNSFQATQLITFLTIGYLIARGLAKSGSRERYNA